MKKLLITGHNGFIGTNLVESLVGKYELFGVSLNKLPQKVNQIKKNINKLKVEDLPKNISSIIHLAAITDVEYCQRNPIDCFHANVNGTQNILEIARKINANFLYLSTNHVYGPPKILPIREDHVKNPDSIYATSKLLGEIICQTYAKNFGVNVSVLRLFSVYGKNSAEHLVTTKIISQILNNSSIQLGNLFPKRDFIYIDDVINAIKLVLTKTRNYNEFNVGTGKSYSILELCNILKKISGSQIPIISSKSKSRKKEINNVYANSNKLKKLGWSPHYTIEGGLKATFDWAVSNSSQK